TIERALAALPRTGPRTVYLLTGIYRLRDTLVLDQAMEGVTIAACAGETPVLEVGADVPVVALRGTRNVTVEGLTFAASSAAAIMTEEAENCTLSHNTFLNGRTAILLIRSDANTIQYNLIAHPAATGIEMRDGS